MWNVFKRTVSDKHLHFLANIQFLKRNVGLSSQHHINKQICITNITNIYLETLEKDITAHICLEKGHNFALCIKLVTLKRNEELI